MLARSLTSYPIILSVKLGNSLSQPISVLSGVPQDSLIGPMLFLRFIKQYFYNLAVSFKLYADDIKLYFCYNVYIIL